MHHNVRCSRNNCEYNLLYFIFGSRFCDSLEDLLSASSGVPSPSRMADADAMPSDSREFIRFVSSSFSRCGRMVNNNIKVDATTTTSCTVRFEAIFKGTDFDVAKTMKEQMGSVDAFLKQMGTKLRLEFTPSSKADSFDPEFYEKQWADVERIRFEYSTTTIGMMTSLFVWSHTRRCKDKHFTSLAMLDAIFPLTLDAKHFFCNACDKKFARELDTCIDRTSQL